MIFWGITYNIFAFILIIIIGYYIYKIFIYSHMNQGGVARSE